ncbi:MAG: hypothetical protein ACLRYI_08165 [Bacteroides uniformis]
MKKYRIKIIKCYVVGADKYGCEDLYVIPKYKVQVKILFVWITVKSFIDMDTDYAKNCAEELIGNLKEGI